MDRRVHPINATIAFPCPPFCTPFRVSSTTTSLTHLPHLVVPDLWMSHIINSPFRALVKILFEKASKVSEASRRVKRIHTSVAPCNCRCLRCPFSGHLHPRNCATRRCDSHPRQLQTCGLFCFLQKEATRAKFEGLRLNETTSKLKLCQTYILSQ